MLKIVSKIITKIKNSTSNVIVTCLQMVFQLHSTGAFNTNVNISNEILQQIPYHTLSTKIPVADRIHLQK